MSKQVDQAGTYSAILIDMRGQREEVGASSVKKLHTQIKDHINRNDIDVFIHEYHDGEKKFSGRSGKWLKEKGDTDKKKTP